MTEREASREKFEEFAIKRWGSNPAWRATGPFDPAWAAWQASRQQALEEATAAVDRLLIDGLTRSSAYGIGVREAIDAIRSLTSPIGDKA